MQYRLYIGTIGDVHMPGTWEALEKASDYCVKQGIGVIVEAIANCCVTPFHGLAMMRNMAIVMGLNEGTTHIMLIDTDILVDDEQALHKLMLANQPAVVPYFDQSSLNNIYKITDPLYKPLDKPVRLQWSIMSCVMFQAQIFRNIIDPRLFSDHMAVAEDMYYWAYLKAKGIDCIQWPVNVKMLRPPTNMWEIDKKYSINVEQPDIENPRIKLRLLERDAIHQAR